MALCKPAEALHRLERRSMKPAPFALACRWPIQPPTAANRSGSPDHPVLERGPGSKGKIAAGTSARSRCTRWSTRSR